jgi:hypothetical protein
MTRNPPVPRALFVVAALAVLAFVMAGAAPAVGLASKTASPTVSVQPQLKVNTNAACNAPQKKGFARCLSVVRTAVPGTIVAQASGPPASALNPADIQAAYHLPTGGGGQTVAIVDAYGYTQAEADLAVFRSEYGLSPCTSANGCFRKVDQNGGTNYPADDSGWGLETALDLDAVSSACPACNILLVEGNDASFDSLGTAVDTAVALGAKFVSNSYGVAGEFDSEAVYDHFYDHPGVAVLASSGDDGNVTNWPSTSPNVVSVGGTRLTRDASVARGWTEAVWGTTPTGAQGAGSGCSLYEPRPDYQLTVDTNCPNNRADADIAADADPASGLAVYDTFEQSGWLQVGGTSLASPLVAAMYALAGPPMAGTYPVTYPYHDPNQAEHLFDITQGVNGDCGNLLCQAGPGWDGPTGLGTPNGVAALSSGPHAVLVGKVTDQATGAPIAGATVSASPGGWAARTDASGGYRFDIAAGTYDLTVKAYSYATATRTGVAIGTDQTITADFALSTVPGGVLSGTVSDASGHGWPLHAQISISGYPDGSVYTDPATGRYSVQLPQGDYTLTVSTDMSGYQSITQQVTIGTSGLSHDITLDADLAACTAAGYGWNGASTDFTGWTGATTRDGWAISGSKDGWRFDNPGNRPAPQTPPYFTSGGDDNFAVADSGASSHKLDTTLTSPSVDLSGQSAPRLEFDTNYYAAPGQTATAQLSVDGGKTWTSLWHSGASNFAEHVSIAAPAAAGQHDVRVRFHYAGSGGWYWGIDNVFVGAHTCVAQRGGLLVGVVTDHTTGKTLNGAQVTRVGQTQQPAFPAGFALATADPALPGGYYWLFSPTGSQQLTTAKPGYTTATTTVEIGADQLVRHDVALTPHDS